MAAPTRPLADANPAGFSGLELLAPAVVILDGAYVVRYTNPAAENLLGTGAKSLVGQPLPARFTDSAALEGMRGGARALPRDHPPRTGECGPPGAGAAAAFLRRNADRAAGHAAARRIAP